MVIILLYILLNQNTAGTIALGQNKKFGVVACALAKSKLIFITFFCQFIDQTTNQLKNNQQMNWQCQKSLVAALN